MSRTSGRNLVRLPIGVALDREEASCSILASGSADRSSSSMSIPIEEMEEDEEAEDLRRRFAGLPDGNAQSGVGLRR